MFCGLGLLDGGVTGSSATAASCGWVARYRPVLAPEATMTVMRAAKSLVLIMLCHLRVGSCGWVGDSLGICKQLLFVFPL